MLSKKEIIMSIEKAKKIILENGNSFHSKVINKFRDTGWHVLVSPYYSDSYTNKPREIDLVVEKDYFVKEAFGSVIGKIIVRLFVECKYFNKTHVFWFDKKNKAQAQRRIVSDTIFDPSYENIQILSHRYLSEDKVAKLYASETNPSTRNEQFYKAISQSLSAMTYFQGRPSNVSREDTGREGVLSELIYPVIICNRFDNFFSCDIENEDNIQLIESNFQFEVQYAYFDNKQRKKNEYFLVDIVDFNNMDSFTKLMEESEIKALKQKLRDEAC